MALTNNKVQFAYFANKTDFTAELQTSLTNSIVFVEDTKEVYTHGTFFGIQAVTLNYDSASTKLQLKDGSAVISEIDATPFIKDGMIDSVELVTTPEGSSAVLSVNGTNYPIETIDALTLPDKQWDYADTWHDGMKVLPVLDPNKAYKIINVKRGGMQNPLDVIFQNSGSFILQFPELTMTSDDVANNVEAIYAPIVYDVQVDGNTEIPISTSIGQSAWVRYTPNYTYHPLVPDPENEYPYTEDESTTYYGFDIDNPVFSVLSSATETTGSASNDDYPTLPYLKFTFNIVKESESGTPISSHQVVRVSVADLVDTYDGANVYLSSNYAKAVSYADPAINDSVDTAVGKLTKGVSDAQTQLMWNEYAGA